MGPPIRYWTKYSELRILSFRWENPLSVSYNMIVAYLWNCISTKSIFFKIEILSDIEICFTQGIWISRGTLDYIYPVWWSNTAHFARNLGSQFPFHIMNFKFGKQVLRLLLIQILNARFAFVFRDQCLIYLTGPVMCLLHNAKIDNNKEKGSV